MAPTDTLKRNWQLARSDLAKPRGKLLDVPVITAVIGDITEQEVEAIVDAVPAGGVDGALHGGGKVIVRECTHRFPDGLAPGEAGWSTAGGIPARWVIHTVVPNYEPSRLHRRLLASCYRRAIEVADDLGARSLAVPLIGAGIHGWPLGLAVSVAVETIAAADSGVEEIRIVAFDSAAREELSRCLGSLTPVRILEGIQNLHQRGYHCVRAWPTIGGPGFWRVLVASADDMIDDQGYVGLREGAAGIRYSEGGLAQFAGGEVTVATSPQTVADLILKALPGIVPIADDPDYVAWFADLMEVVERTGEPPIANDDGYIHPDGWVVGPWDDRVVQPHPPAPPAGAA